MKHVSRIPNLSHELTPNPSLPEREREEQDSYTFYVSYINLITQYPINH